ncbi:MAG: Secretion system C-terminal sorting domain [Bacteroidota bacterium]
MTSDISDSVNLYPNPATEFLVLSTSIPFSRGQVQVFNSQGTLVRSMNLTGVATSMPVTDLPEGVYSLHVRLDGGIIAHKVFENRWWLISVDWENDWWAGVKTIVNPCSVWIDHSVNVRMKYSNEWYFFNCGVASSLWPTTGSTWTVNNAKCRFTLRRTI